MLGFWGRYWYRYLLLNSQQQFLVEFPDWFLRLFFFLKNCLMDIICNDVTVCKLPQTKFGVPVLLLLDTYQPTYTVHASAMSYVGVWWEYTVSFGNWMHLQADEVKQVCILACGWLLAKNRNLGSITFKPLLICVFFAALAIALYGKSHALSGWPPLQLDLVFNTW